MPSSGSPVQARADDPVERPRPPQVGPWDPQRHPLALDLEQATELRLPLARDDGDVPSAGGPEGIQEVAAALVVDDRERHRHLDVLRKLLRDRSSEPDIHPHSLGAAVELRRRQFWIAGDVAAGRCVVRGLLDRQGALFRCFGRHPIALLLSGIRVPTASGPVLSRRRPAVVGWEIVGRVARARGAGDEEDESECSQRPHVHVAVVSLMRRFRNRRGRSG